MSGYDDIIHLSRPKSKKHPPMPREQRAAQFASFAALRGFDDEIAEAARQDLPDPQGSAPPEDHPPDPPPQGPSAPSDAG